MSNGEKDECARQTLELFGNKNHSEKNSPEADRPTCSQGRRNVRGVGIFFDSSLFAYKPGSIWTPLSPEPPDSPIQAREIGKLQSL